MAKVSERKREYNRAYYVANRDRLRDRQASYYRRNAEMIRERVARNRDARPEDPDAKRQRSRRRYQQIKAERPTFYAEKRARRRALEASALVGVVDFDLILERDAYRCHICKADVEVADLHFDHVIPLCRGGEHSNDNLRVAHGRCNRSKGARLLEEMR